MKVTSYSQGRAGDFAFTAENLDRAKRIIARYPEGRQASAVIALLDLAQRQNSNWLTPEAIAYVANTLDMAPIRVHEVASFYTMFNLEPVGKYLIQVCRTTPCWLCGSDDLTRTSLDKLGTRLRETSEDGLFTVIEVECLGACANAPMVQINDDYYEDLSAERMAEIIDALRDGKEVPVGPQTGREAGAATAAQTRILDLLDDVVPAQLDQLLGAVPNPALARGGEAPIVLAVEVGEDPVLVLEHHDSPGPPASASGGRSVKSTAN